MNHNPYASKRHAKVVVAKAKPKYDLPSGTIKKIVEWVDGDKDKAQFAIDAEHAEEKPRSTLIDELQEVIDSE